MTSPPVREIPIDDGEHIIRFHNEEQYNAWKKLAGNEWLKHKADVVADAN